MSDLEICPHAHQRMNQRGICESDVALILQHGVRVDEEAYLLRSRDVQREITALKRRVRRLERLKGSKVVIRDGTVVTVYKQTGKLKH